ncbi:MAG TPA: hypothetical protein VN646_16860 [Candidatus Acidoferrum sp.]|nr:hypothetical protein [Candidatus Acidoferrum sp.]
MSDRCGSCGSNKIVPDPRQGKSGFGGPTFKVWGPDDDPQLDRVLFISAGNLMTAAASADVYISTPSAKCLTLICFAIENEQSNALPNPLNSDCDDAVTGYPSRATLWAASQTHMSGRAQVRPPTKAIRGTRTAPVVIPTDASLWGHEIEIQTAGEDFFARLAIPIQTPYLGLNWHVSVRYAALEPMSDAEWRDLRGRGRINCPPPQKLI